jgi:hydroxymethylbilane synthase
MTDLRIATRSSALALIQAAQVADLLSSAHDGLDVSLVEVTTSGDRDRTAPVTTLTEVGAFVRAVQQAVLDGDADLAVHSCKDLPVDGPDGLVAFYPPRQSPWDVLCGHDLDSLSEGAVVGTGSPRRVAQMRQLRPDVEIREIRGNVDTRLEKIRAGEFDAVILAEAGLRRLGRESEASHRFTVEEMVPAPAQGALAVEAIAGGPAAELIRAVDDPATRRAVEAERAVLALSRAGCRSALGVLGTLDGSQVRVVGFVEDDDGPRRGEAVASDPAAAARRLQGVLGL